MVFWRDYNWCVWFNQRSWSRHWRAFHTWVHDVPSWLHTSESVYCTSYMFLLLCCLKVSAPCDFFLLLFLQILLFYFPLTYYLNHVMSYDSLNGRGLFSHCCSCCSHMMMVLVLLFQCLQYRNMVIPYGPMATLISPGMTWVFLMALILIGVALWTRSKHGRTRTP